MLRDIYIVKNHTLKEVYFGTTSKRVRDSLSDLRHHRAPCAQHWDWQTQDIEWRVMARHVPLPVVPVILWRLKQRKRGDWRSV